MRGGCEVGEMRGVRGGCEVGEVWGVRGGCEVGEVWGVRGGCEVGEVWGVRGGCEGAGVSGAETSNQWLLLGGRRVSRVSMPRLGGALRLGVRVRLLKTGRERGREGENIRTEIGLLARVQGVAGEI